MKTFRTKMREFSQNRDFSLNEDSKHWIFSRPGLEIHLEKHNEKLDSQRAERILNEMYNAGYTSSMGNNGEPYVEYKVIPLNHDLEQKVPKQNLRYGRNIQVGSYVTGSTKKTHREFSGRVVRFSRTNFNDIVTVYILAKENGSIVPLDPETVRISSPFPKPKQNKVMLDMGNSNFSNHGGYSL